MTEIDDFKLMSTRMFVIFINFADAFGSVCRKFILKSLEKFSIPRVCHLVEYLCKYPCFQVIGTNNYQEYFLSFLLQKPEIQSAMIFIMLSGILIGVLSYSLS